MIGFCLRQANRVLFKVVANHCFGVTFRLRTRPQGFLEPTEVENVSITQNVFHRVCRLSSLVNTLEHFPMRVISSNNVLLIHLTFSWNRTV